VYPQFTTVFSFQSRQLCLHVPTGADIVQNQTQMNNKGPLISLTHYLVKSDSKVFTIRPISLLC